MIGPFPSIANDFGPLAIVTQMFEAENGARAALVPEELQAAATGGVHGEHDVVVHRAVLANPLNKLQPKWSGGARARHERRVAATTWLRKVAKQQLGDGRTG